MIALIKNAYKEDHALLEKQIQEAKTQFDYANIIGVDEVDIGKRIFIHNVNSNTISFNQLHLYIGYLRT